MDLVLASASPRRADLLRAAGIPFEVCQADVDESRLAGENPDPYVRRLAEAKARAVAAARPGRIVLGADTVVVLEGRILGKPTDAEDARRMLRLLSGRTHEVLTGVCVIGPPAAFAADAASAPKEGGPHDNIGPPEGGPHDSAVRKGVDTRVAVTTVEFGRLEPADVDWYVASGEPMDKAGAYAIQGLASRFVSRIEGSYSNVVGLPVALVSRMCTEAGILLS